ncbi:MAG: hypothetical protein NVSMB39_1060 [Candidatus Saccharimonadales bacterium]
MSMRNDDLWDHRADRFERHPFLSATIWVIGIIVVVGLIGGGIWAFNVFFSPAKGAGDAYAQKNSAQNWTNAQAQFNQDYQAVLAFDSQIADAQANLAQFEKAHPQLGNGTPYDPVAEQDANLRRTVTGLTQQCQNTVAAYNTRANSYLSKDFRDANLPAQIPAGEHCVASAGMVQPLPSTSVR